MSLDAAKQAQLDELLGGLCDQGSTPEQLDTLYALLADDRDARAYYADYLLLHGTLSCDQANQFDGVLRAQFLAELQPAPAPAPMPLPAATRAGVWARAFNYVQQPVVFSLLVATLGTLSLILTTAQIMLPRRAAVEPPVIHQGTPTVARVTQMVDSRWRRLPAGGRLQPGTRLELLDGAAEIQFHQGARLVLESPAELEIVDGGEAVLHVGSLVAFVPPQATGFQVHTPGLTVIDRGTEFAVATDRQGVSRVLVYTGSVEIRLHGQTDQPGPQVLAGAAAQLDADGVLHDVNVETLARWRFLRTLSPHSAQVRTLWCENFEGPRRYTPDNSPGIFNGATKWGELLQDLHGDTQATFTGHEGLSYFYGQCLDDREATDEEHGFPDPPGHAITFEPVNVSAAREVQLTLLLAATSLPRGPFNAQDFLCIEAACDDGPFETLARFTGPARGAGPLRCTSEDRQLTLEQTFHRFRFPLPECQQVTLRIRAQSANGSRTEEAIGIDDVRIEGIVREE